VQDLERAVEAPEIVRALTAYGLTQQEVGTIAGVSDRAVRQWRRAGIKQDRYDRLLSAGLFDNALASLGEDGSAALSEDARRRRPVGMVTSDRRRGDARLFSCV
jgi:transcriptional regulator with XRE-family HTH domain